jgi:hypothetical protein
MPPPIPARLRKTRRLGQSQATRLPRAPSVSVPIESRNSRRGPSPPLNQPVDAVMTVRAIPGAVKIQWLWYSSTRRLVIIWGKTRRVLEASMANVMSPRPSRAVISQRSRLLTSVARLVWVSIVPCYSIFLCAAHAVRPRW